MPTIIIGNTSKPINSTSRVIYGGGTTITAKLKEPCSIQRPVFLLQGITKNALYNFLKWEADDLDRYYWIDDIVFVTNDICEVHCHLDPLATFQDYIRDNAYYVKYGDNQHWDQWIDDFRFSPERQLIYSGNVKSFQMFGGSTGWSHPENAITIDPDGIVMMRVMECGSEVDVQPIWNGLNAAGVSDLMPVQTILDEMTYHHGVNTYAIRYSVFMSVIREMSVKLGGFAADILGSDAGIAALLKCAAKFWGSVAGASDWRANLISITYLPISFDSICSSKYDTRWGRPCRTFWIGGIPCGIEGWNHATDDRWFLRMKSPICIAQFNGAVDIPWDTTLTAQPGQSTQYKYSFLRNDRWFSLQVYTPGGFQDMDVQELRGQTSVRCWTSLDLMTGNWSMRFTETGDPGSEVLASYSGCIGVNLTEFAGSAENGADQVNGVLNTIAAQIIKAYTHVDVTQAAETMNNYQNAPVDLKPGTPYEHHQVSMDMAHNYYGATNVEQISNGIMGSFNPTGVDPTCPGASMSGNVSNLFLTNDPGKCYLIGIQYIPNDLVQSDGVTSSGNYNKFCDKHGYPVNAWLNLKDDDVTGYVCCVGAYLDYCLGANNANLATINNYLNNGIYIEE